MTTSLFSSSFSSVPAPQQSPDPVAPAVPPQAQITPGNPTAPNGGTASTPAPTQGGNASSSSLVPVLSITDVKEAVPPHLRASVTQGMVDTLNNITSDPFAAENIRNNFISYSAVMKEGKFKTEDYIHAVAYVSFKLMGYSNEEAYARALPQRYAILKSAGKSQKDISAYVSAFHKGKMVNLIMEQSLVPTWVLNQDLHQKALNRLADLMVNAQSEKVQAESAIGLLSALAKPKDTNFQINVGNTENSGLKELKDMMGALAVQQQEIIKNGQMKTIDVAGARLINKDSE